MEKEKVKYGKGTLQQTVYIIGRFPHHSRNKQEKILP